MQKMTLSQAFSMMITPMELVAHVEELYKQGVELTQGELSFLPLTVPEKPISLPSTAKDKEILSMFLEEMKELLRMSEEEQAAAFKSGEPDELTKVIEANLYLVPNILKRYTESPSTDILQEANFEIIAAAEDYDFENANYGFSLYAAFRIQRAVLSFIENHENENKSSNTIRSKYNEIADSYMRLKAERGTEPEVSELAALTGADEDIIEEILIQLHEQEGKTYKRAHHTHGKKKNDADDALKAQVSELLKFLNDDERKIIELRYGLHGKALSVEETAAALMSTAEYVQKTELSALSRLRNIN